MGKVFRAVGAQKVRSVLNGSGGNQSPTHALEHRLCIPGQPLTGADVATVGGDVAIQLLLKSAQSRRGLVQLKTKAEAEAEKEQSRLSLFNELSKILNATNGRGIKLDEKLSIMSIKMAATYSDENGDVARRRSIIKFYDAGRRRTFEIPLTEIVLRNATPEAFIANLAEIKSAMDAHLYATDKTFLDSLIQPNLISLEVPQSASLLALFEDTLIRILSNPGLTIHDVQQSALAFCERTGISPEVCKKMVDAMLVPNSDPNAIAVLKPELVQPVAASVNSNSTLKLRQMPDDFRRMKNHVVTSGPSESVLVSDLNT